MSVTRTQLTLILQAQSAEEAVRWWRLVANNSEAPDLVALYMLGMALENGEGVPAVDEAAALDALLDLDARRK